MHRNVRSIAGFHLAVVLLVAAAGSRLAAQQPQGVKRTVLMKREMSLPGREGVMALVELPPGAAEGRHTHPAEVFAFVQEGEVVIEVEGSPATTLKAGETFYIPPATVHQATNAGSAPARLLAVFVAEKGKPLTTQVAR